MSGSRGSAHYGFLGCLVCLFLLAFDFVVVFLVGFFVVVVVWGGIDLLVVFFFKSKELMYSMKVC